MSKSDKVCYLFTQRFPYGNDETFVELEIRKLADYFKEVIIFPLEKKPGTSSVSLPVNVKSVYLFDQQKKEFNAKTTLRRNVSLSVRLVANEFLKRPLITLKQIRTLISDLLQQCYRAEVLNNYLAKENQKNIVFYSYWFDRWALILSILKRNTITSFEFISRAHGYEVFKDQTKFGYHPFKEFMLSGVKRVYAVSKLGRDYIKKQYRVSAEKISYAYLGVTENKMNSFDNGVFRLVSCAHVRGIKRLDKVCDILAFIPPEVNVEWTLIGGGEDLEMIKTKSKTLPGNISCFFTGDLSSQQVLNYYSENPFNLFLSVSRSEGLPFTMIEAISFGIPLMSTDVGGCSEIVTEQTGMLINKDFDPQEVAGKIVEFMHSDKNSQNFRMGVRKFWQENFDADKNYEKFYRGL